MIKIFFLLIILSSNSFASQMDKIFDFTLDNKLISYSEYLSKPSIIYNYIQYKKIRLAPYQTVIFHNNKSISIGFGTLTFLKVDKNIYYYNIDLSKEFDFSFQVELHIDKLLNKVTIYIPSEINKNIPNSFIERVENKLIDTFNLDNQKLIVGFIRDDLKDFDSIDEYLLYSHQQNYVLNPNLNSNSYFFNSFLILIWLFIFIINIILRRRELN